jgi:chitinase
MDTDKCFAEAVAAPCCKGLIDCGPDAQNPVAAIYHPGTGETRYVSDGAVPFSGVGNDPQDGALTGASLVWTSNIDGQIGTGETFNKVLTAGAQVITLTVTDSNNNTGTDSITLNMQP